MRLVNADALHDSIDKETYRHTYIEQIHSIIDNAPTIDAEPVKHGEWIRLEIKGVINPLTGKNRTYTGCSCCGEPIPTDSILDCIEEEEVNFCFGCGAKMKGQEE